MDTTSLWQKISPASPSYPELQTNLEVDVAIIGGGITGISTAMQLIDSGKKIAIIEAKNIGGVVTSYSSGNLYVAVQPYYQEILSKFDLDTAKTVAHSRQFAINYIEEHGHGKVSRRPWFIYTDDENKIPFLEKEVETFKKMGFDIKYTENLPLPFRFKKAAVMENQARFNPLEYVREHAQTLSKQGCQIFEKTRIVDIREKDVCTLKTDKGHKIVAKNVVLATHTPIGIQSTHLFTAPYRSYAVVAKLKEQPAPEGHFWDLSSPHHATCTHAISGDQPELVLVAGSHHKVGQEKDTNLHYQELEKFLRDHFSIDEISYQWSSQHYHSADDIPYIGLVSKFAKHTYMATGYFADGLVYGVIAGMIISDLINGKKNPWSEVYNSTRLKLAASSGFLMKENTNILMQYYKDFPQSNVDKFDQVKKGEAKVLEMDNEKWGVYKDDNNKLHVVSAVCTHMKCIVNWNTAEKTWDCPCHGSRFSMDGEVIEGPAEINLRKK